MTNLIKRIITSILGIAILLWVVYIGEIPFVLFVMLISILGILEFFNLLKNTQINCYKFMGITTSICISILFYLTKGQMFLMQYDILLPAVLTIFMLLAFTISVLTTSDENTFFLKLKNSIFTIIGVFYASWLVNHLILLRNIPNFGRNLVYILFFSIWSLDVFAYFGGMKFGKTKLSKISPNKTWEGAIIGFLASIATFYGLANYVFEMNFGLKHILILATIIGIFGQIGDLLESLIKRSVNQKDSGILLPGHGGILDRFDSIIFTTPILYYYIKILL